MNDEPMPKPEHLGISRWKRIARGVAIGAAVLLLCLFALVAQSLIQTTGIFRRQLEISAADIPMYFNARDISEQEPVTRGFPQVTT